MENQKTSALTVGEQNYTTLHNEILQYGNMTISCYVEFSKKLKEMRDKKLYLEVGISTFGDYVEQQVGIKERQAYNYITVYEKYSEDFLHLNAKIGVTKLMLLAPLSETEREEILDEVDVESTTVAKLKEEIAARDKTIETLQADKTSLQEDLNGISAERDELSEQLNELDNNQEELAGAIEEKNKAQTEKNRIAEELKKVTEELEKLRKATPKIEKVVETVQIENPETTKALVEANKRIEQLKAEQQALNKKLEVANDDTMSKFKSKFEDLQLISRDIFNLLSAMDASKAEKCKAAIKAVVGGWNL